MAHDSGGLAPVRRRPQPKRQRVPASTVANVQRAVGHTLSQVVRRAPRRSPRGAAGLPGVATVLRRNRPTFRAEGPQLYGRALTHNKQFAKPGPYQTGLSHHEEHQFRKWVKAHGIPFDPSAKTVDYDMRGYFKATGGAPHTLGQHFPDTFKTPFDTTFSRESKYATGNNPFVWRGDRLMDRRSGQVVFSPASLGRRRPRIPSLASVLRGLL